VRVLAVLAGNVMGLGKPLPVFTLSGSSGITDFDLFGQPQSWTDDDGKERLVWLPGVVDLASRVGGILDLDEIGMMGERVTSSLHPVCDWRRMFVNRNKPVLVPGDGFMPEQVKVSDDLWIVATTNPSTYRGSGTLNEAFANRFRHIMWDYDESVEKVLIRNEGVLALGEALRNARAVNHVRTPIGTAALIRCAQDVERDGVDMALFCLVSMFTSDERPVVNEIIESRSYRGLISKAASDGGSIFDLPDEDQPF